MKPTTRKEFKQFAKNISDFNTLPAGQVALICWFGRSGQSYSYSKIRKLFDFTDEQVKQLSETVNILLKRKNEFGGNDFLGLFFYLDTYKVIFKDPTQYAGNKEVIEKYSIKNFLLDFKLQPGVIFK